MSQLEYWAVFCIVFLRYYGVHPATYEMFPLLEKISGVSPRLWAQDHQQPTFPAALLRLIHQKFNERFRQALKKRKRVRWPDFNSLRRALALGNLRPELVSLSGGLAQTDFPLPPHTAPHIQALATPQMVAGTTPTPQAQGSRRNQAQEKNPHPVPQMHFGPGFWIRTAIGKAAANGVYIPQTDNGRHFCLSYHLKGACNTHCGGRQLHRPLSQSEFGRLGEWRDRYCGREEVPLVR